MSKEYRELVSYMTKEQRDKEYIALQHIRHLTDEYREKLLILYSFENENNRQRISHIEE